MRQHDRRLSSKRIVRTLNSRTTIITSDKALMMAMWPSAGSGRSAVAWKREAGRDRRTLNGFDSAHLRFRRALDWAEYAAEFAPAVGVKTPAQGPQSSAAHTWRPAVQWAWWEKIPARTAALAYIVTVTVTAAVGSALIARGAVR
jgi:hypothetical protein